MPVGRAAGTTKVVAETDSASVVVVAASGSVIVITALVVGTEA